MKLILLVHFAISFNLLFSQVLDAPVRIVNRAWEKNESRDWVRKTSIGKVYNPPTSLIVNQKPEIQKYSIDFNKNKLLRKLKPDFKNLVFIQGGTISYPEIDGLFITKNDSTLLSYISANKYSVSSFMMSEAEITNAEYREFVHWVRDSIAHRILGESDEGHLILTDKNGNDLPIPVINWKRKIKWNKLSDEEKEALEVMYFPSHERFFNKHEFDTRKLMYEYKNQNGQKEVIEIYPDTLAWTRDFSYSYNEILKRAYFWHPFYDICPVVGISWEQANAYCYWKSVQLKHKLAKKGINVSEYNLLRLPTEQEWEYAALGDSGSIYPWAGSKLIDGKTKYLANFGIIKDYNQLISKDFKDDGGLNSMSVKSFASNNHLYDMAGNIAEWTSTAPNLIFNYGYYEKIDTQNCPNADRALNPNEPTDILKFQINDSDSISDILTQIIGFQNKTYCVLHLDTIILYTKNELEYKISKMLRDRDLIKKTENPRIVKGGSWADAPCYMICQAREVRPKDYTSCRIGFRVAMSLSPELLKYLKLQ